MPGLQTKALVVTPISGDNFRRRMTGYAFDTKGPATINVINPKCLVHLTKWWKWEVAVKAAFEEKKFTK